MTDTLFIVPPFSYKGLDDTSLRYPHGGIPILAAALEKHKYKIKILDMFVLSLKEKDILDYSKDFKYRMAAVTSLTSNSL